MKTLHPGIYIKEILKTSKITPKEFAIKTGIPEDIILGIINGQNDITYDVACKLSLYFGNSINFWLNLQKNYNKD